MWLASISKRRGNGLIHPARDFSTAERREAYQRLKRTLEGVGDERFGRHFRMCVTQCLHRGLSDQEIALLPEDWKSLPAIDVAGAPVEIFWQKGVPEDCVSARPCFDPGKQFLDDDLYTPLDCGDCPPCEARLQLQRDGAIGGP